MSSEANRINNHTNAFREKIKHECKQYKDVLIAYCMNKFPKIEDTITTDMNGYPDH